jgi:hypothetical protein
MPWVTRKGGNGPATIAACLGDLYQTELARTLLHQEMAPAQQTVFSNQAIGG